ncbi:MAG TPA: GDCCVxC domain-containing (seleno)protein [Gammaproteobacteria bacterium]|nr:GDCCVxC domain-containing (seleno)protein [Gammaproteobacteria bacterium]HPQ26575.1 GDCCVxC domain-containing (seleno)protein [Gammaproteobacteria bacterium]
MTDPVLDSTLTCPECGFTQTETMPTDQCVWYWQCPGCSTLLRPQPGDCCVYCSYGSVPCPPVQLAGEGSCCGPSTE